MGWQGSASGPRARLPAGGEDALGIGGRSTKPCFLSQELSPRRRDRGFAGRKKEQQGFTDLWEHIGRGCPLP